MEFCINEINESLIIGYSKMNQKAILFSLFVTTAGISLISCDNFVSKTPLTGARESVLPLESTITSNPALSGHSVVLPPAENLLDWPQPGGKLNNALPVLSFSESSKMIWKTSIGGGSTEEHKLISTPVFHNQRLFVMDANGQVSAVDSKDGKILWSLNTTPSDTDGIALGGGVSCEGDTLYVATSFGDVFALDQTTGAQKWKQSVVNPSRVAPLVHNGKVFVTTVANEVHALSAQTGESLWTHTGTGELTGLLGTATPALVDNLLIVPYSSGEVFALRTENGYPSWSDTLATILSVDSISSIPHIRARPVVYGDVAYLVSHGGRLAAVDLKTGIRQWQKEISGVHTPAVVGNYIFLITTSNDLVAMNRQSGDVYWATSLRRPKDDPSLIWTGPVAVKDRLLVCNSNGQIVFICPQTGSAVSTINTSDSFTQTPIIVDNVIYILGDSGTLYAYK